MTLVSYEYNFIYLRTRKTASTSTEMYLQAFCVPPGQYVPEFQTHPVVSKYGIAGRRRKDKKLRWYQLPRHSWHVRNGTNIWCPHMAAHEVKAGLTQKFWDGAVKIASVRNPFNRAISSYYWSQRSSQLETRSKEELIESFRRRIRNRALKDDRDIVFLDGQFVPDILIRQEYLVEDLNAVGDRLGCDTSRAQLPTTKKTKSSTASQRPTTAEFYDNETADIVRDHFSWVFEHANYSLEVPG